MNSDLWAAQGDPFDARRAFGAQGMLAEFNAAGLVSAGDVHVARRLGELLGDLDEAVLLAAAFAVRAPRMGHVCVDLSTVREAVTVDADGPVNLDRLSWPDPSTWAHHLAQSSLVGRGPDGLEGRPLRVDGHRVYLDRCWWDERTVAAGVIERAQNLWGWHDVGAGLDRLFARGGDDLQRRAAECALASGFTVISGGPGTGKTTTVARILALLGERARAADAPMPITALAAPTGKAADRLHEAVAHEVATLDVSAEIRAWLGGLQSSTLHRLLGAHHGRRTPFAPGTDDPLPHDVVVVDEASMVSLALMARLIRALRDDAQLILVGDAGQLASVEAGAVLGDIVGPAVTEPDRPPLGEHIVVLEKVHRYGKEIGALAEAVREGNDDAAMAVLRAGYAQVQWISPDTGGRTASVVRAAAVAAGRSVFRSAELGSADSALVDLGAFRVLCAHRRGPHGVLAWTRAIESWLTHDVAGFSAAGEWYLGRPVLVIQNDYGMGLFNGDVGVVVAGADGRPMVAFERAGEVVEFSPYRLGAVETVHAMTIHKSQGSEFPTVAVVVPDAVSRLLTRELLYTAITRARSTLILIGSEDAVRAAVRRPIARASGLKERLWDEEWPMIVYGSEP